MAILDLDQRFIRQVVRVLEKHHWKRATKVKSEALALTCVSLLRCLLDEGDAIGGSEPPPSGPSVLEEDDGG